MDNDTMRFVTFEKLFEDAEKSDFLQEAQDGYRKDVAERDDPDTTQSEWAILAPQVVGHEKL